MIRTIRRFVGHLSKDSSAGLAPARPRLVMDQAEWPLIYAIGDVHGCYEQLMDAERRISEDSGGGRALMVLVGDYVDRGARSRDVLEHLCQPSPRNIHRIALCGNHDDWFSRFLNNELSTAAWLRFAGYQTLTSYGVDAAHILRVGDTMGLRNAVDQAVPASHRILLGTLPSMLQIGNLIFVHAGIRNGLPLEHQSDEDLMWIREPFLTRGPELPIIVVHGHTPQIRPHLGNGRIGIDTGCYATGRLTVVKIANGAAKILS
ncbi:metallophosphoesterase family protein [Rhizobium sp. ZK1]|uniref:metallophosphoesterase family protein n=1 Tax=Rhizobium sp. ZK1 TaxID=3389872 RepID=UPI0039F68115